MFIIIEDDVFFDLEKVKDPFDPRIKVIDALFESMINGKHIIYSNIRNLDKVKKITYLGHRTKQYVSWIIKEFTRVYSCKNIVDIQVYVSCNYEELEIEDNHIKVPLNYFSVINETKLLTENETDANCFSMITEYIMEKQNIGSSFKICFENDAFHGGNGKDKILQLAQKNVIVICIADTDMDFPNDSRKSTYKGVNDAIKKVKNKIIIQLFELPVREKENLIPATIYNKYTDSGLIKVISQTFPNDEIVSNFFDIKDGVKIKKILKPSDKWLKYYRKLIEECKKNNICCEENLKKGDLDSKYIYGIGDKLCDTVCEAIFCSESNELLSSIPEFEIRNWELISKVLFTWGCCLNQERFPAQRNW